MVLSEMICEVICRTTALHLAEHIYQINALWSLIKPSLIIHGVPMEPPFYIQLEQWFSTCYKQFYITFHHTNIHL
jgi:hypothetical protein